MFLQLHNLGVFWGKHGMFKKSLLHHFMLNKWLLSHKKLFKNPRLRKFRKIKNQRLKRNLSLRSKQRRKKRNKKRRMKRSRNKMRSQLRRKLILLTYSPSRRSTLMTSRERSLTTPINMSQSGSSGRNSTQSDGVSGNLSIKNTKVKELLDILLLTLKTDSWEILIISENMLLLDSEFMELKETMRSKVPGYGEELKSPRKWENINLSNITLLPNLITLKKKTELWLISIGPTLSKENSSKDYQFTMSNISNESK